jgi:hypothetical protein
MDLEGSARSLSQALAWMSSGKPQRASLKDSQCPGCMREVTASANLLGYCRHHHHHRITKKYVHCLLAEEPSCIMSRWEKRKHKI